MLIAGRTLADPDSKLALLAVGDDDQNIYTFRGANVEFIRRFQSDYDAKTFFLVENYRSTAYIIAAANSLIAHNHDRMKTDHAIRINKGRELLPPGGPWKDLDPVAQGRVQILQVANLAQQAAALVEELKRLKQRNPSLIWSDCAVLARNRDELAPIRALCEQQGIPIIWGIDRNKTPPLSRIREIRCFLAGLKARQTELLTTADVIATIAEQSVSEPSNVWYGLLLEILRDLQDESSNAQLPVGYVTEYIYEALAEQRREQTIGSGVFLSTVHSAKGMEFTHVFIPGGGWLPGKNRQIQEEERRALYVAMTRARETLCLFKRADSYHPHVKLIEDDFLFKREPSLSNSPDDLVLRRRYDILGTEDLFIDYAGQKLPDDPVHKHLSSLESGDYLFAYPNRDAIELKDKTGVCVSRFSHSAVKVWRSRLDSVESIKIIAMVHRCIEDSGEEFRSRCRCDHWEIPVLEVVYVERTP